MPYHYCRSCPVCGKPNLQHLDTHLTQVHHLKAGKERTQWLKKAKSSVQWHTESEKCVNVPKSIKRCRPKAIPQSRNKIHRTASVFYPEFKYHHPFSMMVVGPTQSGKTYFVRQLLEHDCIAYENGGEKSERKILWYYGQWQDEYKQMRQSLGKRISFVKGLPAFDDDLSDINPRNNTTVILDDLMDLAIESTMVSKLFAQGRHRNVSVILILQNMFPKGKYNRTMSINASYLVLFKSPADRRQIGIIGDRIFDKDKPEFMSVYNRETAQPYSYVIIDCRPSTSPDRQVVSNVFGTCTSHPILSSKHDDQQVDSDDSYETLNQTHLEKSIDEENETNVLELYHELATNYRTFFEQPRLICLTDGQAVKIKQKIPQEQWDDSIGAYCDFRYIAVFDKPNSYPYYLAMGRTGLGELAHGYVGINSLPTSIRIQLEKSL